MTCSKHQRIIDDIGDLDRLPPESARHVDECRACSDFAVDLLALRGLLKEQGRIAAPSDFDARLARRIRAARTQAPSTGILEWLVVPQRMLASAAAFALVAAGAFVVATYQTGLPVNNSLNVATNQPAPTGDAGSGLPAIAGIEEPSTDTAGSGTPLVDIPLRPSLSRPGNRRLQTVSHKTDRDDAMLLIQDSAGARIVNVPRVLVGAERIVPLPDADASIASRDDRMAF